MIHGQYPSILADDPACSPLASYSHHPVDDIEPEMRDESVGARVIRHFVIAMKGEKNLAFAFDCLSLATGVGALDNENGQTVARRWGVTRQEVSKTAIRLCDVFGIDPARFMRSLESRETFRQANRRNLPALK